ncbi:hypothetical protein [Bacillus safensis]|uniref:hypothetical protein n=1 Tax=Bacillus safensis TaxID=561879 RepID=UPI002E222182|nr:hypothetical protein [Bacillus safensis]
MEKLNRFYFDYHKIPSEEEKDREYYLINAGTGLINKPMNSVTKLNQLHWIDLKETRHLYKIICNELNLKEGEHVGRLRIDLSHYKEYNSEGVPLNPYKDNTPEEVEEVKKRTRFALYYEQTDSLEILEYGDAFTGRGKTLFYRNNKGDEESFFDEIRSSIDRPFVPHLMPGIPDTPEEDKRAYAKRCGNVSRATGLPFEIVLAVSPERVDILKGIGNLIPTKEQVWALVHCGIERRKEALYQVLGYFKYHALNVHEMGQINSDRLANYIAKPALDKYRFFD